MNQIPCTSSCSERVARTHPRYFDGEPVILVDNVLIFLSIFWWTTRYFGGELSHFAEHGLVRTTEESKISPWKSVSARNSAVSSN